MTDHQTFAIEVFDKIPAYRAIVRQETGKDDMPGKFDRLPLLTKQNYLLVYPLGELAREEDMGRFHLIGASSGFSKTGAVYWPKRPCDEKDYMKSIETMLADCYDIGRKRTLCIECLAFGMWIGGMQIAAALRGIAVSGRFPFTLATPGLDIKAAVKIINEFHRYFDRILLLTNPSNIPLFTALLRDANVSLPAGTVSFPVVGEYYTETFRERVAEEYGHPLDSPFVVWTGYGSADTGDIGAETAATIALRKFCHRNADVCRQLFDTVSAPMILALSPQCYIEIIDGEIVVTKDQFIPLVRYNTRDRGMLLAKGELTGIVPENIRGGLPEKMICVFGRMDNAVIFYGTNLMIDDINTYLLSLGREHGYGGLFTVCEDHSQGFSRLEFTIYVTQRLAGDAEWFRDQLVDYLCAGSAEFKIKYQNLSASAGVPLITVRTEDIKKIDPKVKHRFIINK